MPHRTLSPAHPCRSLILQPASQNTSFPHRDSSESIENLLVSFAPADSQFAALHGRQLGDPKVEPCARWMSQGFYQRSLCVAMQSHNSSGSQGPAVIVLAWAGVTWRWGRAERLARAKLWLLPIPHTQGKRNTSKMVGVARGQQRADTLKPYSQKFGQSNHTRTTTLPNSMKLSHACGATQDRRVMVERSDRMWSTGEGNGKPLQYSCLENPKNNMKDKMIGY